MFSVPLDVAGGADGFQWPEPLSALPEGWEPEITIHVAGRAVPTSKSWDMKLQRTLEVLLDHPFHFIVKAAGPGRMWPV